MSPINILCGIYKYIHKIKSYTLTTELSVASLLFFINFFTHLLFRTCLILKFIIYKKSGTIFSYYLMPDFLLNFSFNTSQFLTFRLTYFTHSLIKYVKPLLFLNTPSPIFIKEITLLCSR